MKLGMKINPGVGDILLIRNQFDSVIHKYNEIEISLNRPILIRFREKQGTSEYYNFAYDFTKMVFDHPPYIVTENQSFPRMSIIDNDMGVEIPDEGLYKINDYSSFLCEGEKLPKDYIVITTRIRMLPQRSKFLLDVAPTFLCALEELSKKHPIYLIGEREVALTPENKMHGNELIYSIYNELMPYIYNDNLVDMTMNSSEAQVPNISKLKYDCQLMKGAKAVITLGIGGNFILALATATKLYSYIGESSDVQSVIPFYSKMSEYPQRKGISIYTDINKFVENISSIR